MEQQNNSSKYIVNESMGFVDSAERLILLSSDYTLGAQNVSADGSYFEVLLENVLDIPPNSHSVKLDIHRAIVWNNFNNISSRQKNNLFKVTGLLADAVTTQTSTITILDGIYSPFTLDSEIQRLMSNLGFKTGIVRIGAILPLGKTTLTLLAGTTVDFTIVSTCRSALGFDAGTVNTVGLNLSPNKARFNPIDFLLIKSNLSSNEGLLLNSNYGSNVCQIPLSSEPNSQIVSELYQPLDIDASLFKGNSASQKIWVELTDQNGNRVNTNGEKYSLLLKLKYNYVKYDK